MEPSLFLSLLLSVYSKVIAVSVSEYHITIICLLEKKLGLSEISLSYFLYENKKFKCLKFCTVIYLKNYCSLP